MGHRVKYDNVRRGVHAPLAGKPGQKVEETLKHGHGIRGDLLRELPFRVDGRDAPFRRGLESVRRLERIASDIVRESNVLKGFVRVLATNYHFLAIPPCNTQRYFALRQIVKEIRAPQFNYKDDATRQRLCPWCPVNFGDGILHLLGLGQRQDILRRLPCRAATASHDEVHVSAPLAGTMVVPDIAVRIDVERGVLVLAEG